MKIKVKWDTGVTNKDDITMFVITLHDVSKVTTKVQKVKNMIHQISTEYSQIIPVHAFTEYRIEMKSCIQDVCSKYSNSVNITSLEDAPSKVRNLVVVPSLDSVFVSWLPPTENNGILRKYIVIVLHTSGDSKIIDGYPKEVNSNILSIALDNIPHHKKLTIEVKAFTVKAGPGVRKLFQSPEGLPSAPTNVIVVLLKDTIMSIKWDKPEEPNGVIYGYKVKLVFYCPCLLFKQFLFSCFILISYDCFRLSVFFVYFLLITCA